MKKINLIRKIITWSQNNKIKAGISLLVLLAIIYGVYKSLFPTTSVPEYTLAVARIGSINQTVTGSGQVSASNQTDIPSLVSGTIKTINVNVGDHVKTGDLIATIDSTNARLTLENARISYLKVTQPAKEADVQVAKNNLAKAYDSAFGSITQAYLDFPEVISGLKDTLYGQSSLISIQASIYFSPEERNYRDYAITLYDKAEQKYKESALLFKSMSRSSSEADIDRLINITNETASLISEASKQTLSTIIFIKNNNTVSQTTALNTLLTNVTTWTNKASSDVSSLVSAQNSILTSNKSLNDTVTGSDELDVASARLNYEQAQRTYENYFIRAPYDGIIGRIPVNVYSQAGSGTTIATIVGDSKIANIALNEVDAAKVKVSQPVKISFDAIEGLNATGTVKTVDQVGSVSSGVVSYSIKIAIDTRDERIKPGMSVNTTITTLHKEDVLVVPNTAIKQTGNESYIQTLSKSAIDSVLSNSTSTRISTSSSKNALSSSGVRDSNLDTVNASSTRRWNTIGNASSSRQANFNGNNFSRTLTVSTAESPQKIIVKTGDSDDTYTEIISGLNRGQFVITKTTATKSSQTTSAPNIFSSVGARNAGTNANRLTR